MLLHFFEDVHSRLASLNKVFQNTYLVVYKAPQLIAELIASLEMDYASPSADISAGFGLKKLDRKLEMNGDAMAFEGHEVGSTGVCEKDELFDSLAHSIIRPFARGLIKNLMERFPQTREFKAMSIFDLKKFPTDSHFVSRYGDTELDILLTHFDKLDAEKVRMQWHCLKPCLLGELRSKYCDAPGISGWKVIAEELNEDDKYSELLKLVASVLVIPVAAAVVERGFSIRDSLLLTNERDKLNVDTSDWQMRVMQNGPEPYVYDKSAATKAGNRGKPSFNPAMLEVIDRAAQKWADKSKTLRLAFTSPLALNM